MEIMSRGEGGFLMVTSLDEIVHDGEITVHSDQLPLPYTTERNKSFFTDFKAFIESTNWIVGIVKEVNGYDFQYRLLYQGIENDLAHETILGWLRSHA